MRAKWMLLTKLQLTGLLGINRARKSQDPRARRKAAGGLAAFIIVGIVLLLYVALFAIGMCMCLLPQWNAFNQGIVLLLCLIPIVKGLE